MTNLHDVRVWLAAAQFWICFAGFIAIVVGLTVERLSTSHGWPTVKRCVPAIAVAVLLAVLFVARQKAWIPPMPQPLPPAAIKVRQGAGYEPYCEDWWYYTNALCWFER